MYLDDCVAAVRRWEGLVAWMYLDTVGVVTVANGRALQTASDADALPFMIGGRRASFAEVTTDFERVKSMEKGHLAAHYKCSSSVTLEDADMAALLTVDVHSFDLKLQRLLPGYVAAPDAAKRGAFDMAYNLGMEGLLKFHKFCAAFESGNWSECAAQCDRDESVAAFDERNAWTKELFEQAAKAA